MILLLIIFVVLGVSALMFYFSWSISLGVYLKSFCGKPSAKQFVALSFDDGVDRELTPRVLDLLDSYGAKATFCVIGEKVAHCPEIISDIVNRGHTIANHSMYHKGTFPMQSTRNVYNEIMDCNRAIEAVTGQSVKYFRPPFGVTNPMVGRAVRRANLRSIGWSIRSYDTMGHSVERVVARVCKRIKGGDVVLLHDNRADVVEITQGILQYLKENGYKAVSVESLINN